MSYICNGSIIQVHVILLTSTEKFEQTFNRHKVLY